MNEMIKLICPSAKECDDNKCPHRKKHKEREDCKTNPCLHIDEENGCCCIGSPKKEKT
jgi:hypothetical protein